MHEPSRYLNICKVCLDKIELKQNGERKWNSLQIWSELGSVFELDIINAVLLYKVYEGAQLMPNAMQQ